MRRSETPKTRPDFNDEEAMFADLASRFTSRNDQRRLQRLAAEGWRSVATQPASPLQQLQGNPVDCATLEVLLGPDTRYGATAFQLYLRSQAGLLSDGPILTALHHAGPYPSQNWVEVTSTRRRLTFPDDEAGPGFDLDDERGKELQLFSYLAELIPPGGHLMVEYDSPEQRDTARSLALGVPAVATPLGHLLFQVGCGVNIRDWYIPEGGAEGPRKLQGYKALNLEHAKRRAGEMALELRAFLERASKMSRSELIDQAQRRASEVLATLSRQIEERH